MFLYFFTWLANVSVDIMFVHFCILWFCILLNFLKPLFIKHPFSLIVIIIFKSLLMFDMEWKHWPHKYTLNSIFLSFYSFFAELWLLVLTLCLSIFAFCGFVTFLKTTFNQTKFSFNNYHHIQITFYVWLWVEASAS